MMMMMMAKDQVELAYFSCFIFNFERLSTNYHSTWKYKI